MNILASYAWMREYLKTDASFEEFARQTTDAGNSVEHSTVLRDVYAHMVVGQVLSVRAHKDANKLRVARVDIGSQGEVDIVCGGANLAPERRVVVALPGARVRWHGEGDFVEIIETEIRGEPSAGMICAASEIGFSELPQAEHDIWDITDITDAPGGTPISEALGLEDVLFDIEVTSNRPDCKSIIGQAREGAAVTGDAFIWKSPVLPKGSSSAPHVQRETTGCAVYHAVRVDGVVSSPSPWWMQKRLLTAGYNPISFLVDVTNYVLHEYGHPLHAFDADTVQGTVVIREAHEGEQIELLKGGMYTLTASDIVIADDAGPIALAGIMGGKRTAISEGTTAVILESAVFDPVRIRRSARAHQLQTDASQLFDKGLSEMAAMPALARAVELIQEICPEARVSDSTHVQEAPYRPRVFSYVFEETRALMGVPVEDAEITRMLTSLGFEVEMVSEGEAQVTVPYWRDRDIEDPRDFTEEVARLYGYEHIPSRLVVGTLSGQKEDPLLRFEMLVKHALKGAGMTELYSMSFVGEDDLQKTGLSSEDAVMLENPLTQDAAYLRPSLWPSMLEAVARNEREVPEAEVFELAPIHTPNGADIPVRNYRLLVAVYGQDVTHLYARAKGLAERLFEECLVEAKIERPAIIPTCFHETRTAHIVSSRGEVLGYVGGIASNLKAAWGIEREVVVLDVDIEALLRQVEPVHAYVPPPPFPESKRDLACVVACKVEVATLIASIEQASPLLVSAEVFDIYQGKGVPDGKKSVAIHLAFRSKDRTLTTGEVDAQLEQIVATLSHDHGAEIRA